MKIILFYVNSVNVNFPKLGIIKSINKLSNCAFSWAWLPNKSNSFLGFNDKANSFQHPLVFSQRISKPHIFKLYFPFQSLRCGKNEVFSFLVQRVNLTLFITNIKDFLSCIQTFCSRGSILFGLAGWKSSKHDCKNCDENMLRVFCKSLILEESPSHYENYKVYCKLGKVWEANCNTNYLRF